LNFAVLLNAAASSALAELKADCMMYDAESVSNHCLHRSARQVVKGHIPFKGKHEEVPLVALKPSDWGRQNKSPNTKIGRDQ
jgi:hypothetical protein